MKNKNKLITLVLLSAGAAAGTALINKYIQMSAVSRDLLNQPEPLCYKWRLGNVYYTKVGSGKPLLLVHDLDASSSGCEWSKIIDRLKSDYTVYTVDLLGCGRSEKPNLTYTNFLYVQLLNDFVKSEIGRRTNVIATGASASLVTMACSYNPELFEQMMFINPESFSACSQIPGKYAKGYKFILDFPLIGTLLYHFASARNMVEEAFEEQYFYNPYDVSRMDVDRYFESAHLGESPKAIYSSVKCNYTKCNISQALGKIDNSIFILGGAAEAGIEDTVRDYTLCNPAIESSLIPAAKHLPQLENPTEVCNTVKMFFN